ncbi:HET-domain-containing protein [Alternaria alternata]|nr:HET-domain-containing protein [Alternaria alternata]
MSMNALVADGSPNSAETPNVASTQYSPLPHDGDSFRLLRVLPSPISISRIRCELYTASISREEDKYIAGSYVWGPPEPSEPIVINGKSFQVRSNLFRFLRAFRSRHRSQVIWIDAICINQDDVQERGHQVQEMKRVYSNAKCVYCWLNLENAMPYTSTFSLHRVKDLVHWRSRDERRRMRHEEQAEYLVQAKYWSRIWIVQEFLLAKDLTLLTGSHRLSNRRFESIMRDWTGNPPESIGLSNASLLDAFRQGSLPRVFDQMFALFGYMRRSLPQDAVFALLGLVGDRTKDTELIGMIDYSLTVWQLLQCILARDILETPLRFFFTIIGSKYSRTKKTKICICTTFLTCNYAIRQICRFAISMIVDIRISTDYACAWLLLCQQMGPSNQTIPEPFSWCIHKTDTRYLSELSCHSNFTPGWVVLIQQLTSSLKLAIYDAALPAYLIGLLASNGFLMTGKRHTTPEHRRN